MKLSTKLLVSHGVAATALLFAQMASAGTITGSAHDFSSKGWSGGEICKACHAPHNNLNASGLLWNHASTAATFTLYSSPTMDAAVAGQPAGTSKMCLSCHDGTVALDSFGGATGTNFIGTGKANLGTALGNDHPISITYDAALVTADGALKPVSTNVTIGSGLQTKTDTLQNILLTSDKVECSSCHDVHNTFTAGAGDLLKVSNASSALCLTCHVK